MDTADMPFATTDMRGPAIDALRGLPPIASRLRAAAFVELLGASAPEIDRLATICETTPSEVGRLCRAMEEVGAIEIEDGAVITAAGLTAKQSSHALTFPDRRLFTVCAFDAFGIPAALSEPVVASSACRLCRHPLRVEYVGGRGPDGSSAILFWIPRSGITHLRNDFCARLAAFCGPMHAVAWVDIEQGAPGELHTLAEVQRLGRSYWAQMMTLGRRVAPAEARP